MTFRHYWAHGPVTLSQHAAFKNSPGSWWFGHVLVVFLDD